MDFFLVSSGGARVQWCFLLLGLDEDEAEGARRRRKNSLTGHFRVLNVRGVRPPPPLPRFFSSLLLLPCFFLLLLSSSSFSPYPCLLFSSSPPLLLLFFSSPSPSPHLFPLLCFCTEHDRGSVQGRDYAPRRGSAARSWPTATLRALGRSLRAAGRKAAPRNARKKSSTLVGFFHPRSPPGDTSLAVSASASMVEPPGGRGGRGGRADTIG